MTESQRKRIELVNRYLSRKNLDEETLAVCKLFMQGLDDDAVRFKLRMSPDRLKQIKSEIAIGLVLEGIPAGGR